jgi:DNA-binding NtrC family response regulator
MGRRCLKGRFRDRQGRHWKAGLARPFGEMDGILRPVIALGHLLVPSLEEGRALAGCRVLVVEDDALVAENISDILSEADGVLVGPVSTASEARWLMKQGPSLSAALLDVNLGDGLVTPVLEALSARGIPTMVYTGGAIPEDVRQRHPDLIALSKPVLPARLIGELRKLIGQSGRVSR